MPSPSRAGKPGPKPKKRVTSDAILTPPAHLSKEAKAWWAKIVKEYGICDEGGVLLLRGALESFDRSEEARAILKKEGLTNKDKYGQYRPHPAVGIERDAKKNMISFLRALNLDAEPILPMGRPPGGRR